MAENMEPDQIPPMSGPIPEPIQPTTPDMTTTSEEITSTFPHADVPHTQGIFQWLGSFFFKRKVEKDKDMNEIQKQFQNAIVELEAAIRYKQQCTKAALRLQAAVRCWMARRDFIKLRNAAIKIQAAVRCWIARRDFRTFMTENSPPPSIIIKFSRLLNPDEKTITMLNLLEAEVASKQKHIQQQRQELNTIDNDIAALVRGKAILQCMVFRFKKLKQMNRRNVKEAITQKIQHTSQLRRCRELLDCYGRLFYYLQTKPAYFSRLICRMPSEECVMYVMDKVLLPFFQNASRPREEYLLLKVMEQALRTEVQTKVAKNAPFKDLWVMKMVIRFYQQDTHYGSVVRALKPAIWNIIKAKLELAAVNDIFSKPLVLSQQLKGKCSSADKENTLYHMTDAIVKRLPLVVTSMPYGIRFMARVLQQSVQENLPLASKEEVLRAVGCFLYTYLQPALEDPDVLGLDLPGSVQKENLKAVSKALSIAIDSLHFERNSEPEMDSYIAKTTPLLRIFYGDVTNIPEPEEKFGINRFSDATSMETSTIDMLAEDIICVHLLLSEFQDDVFIEKKYMAYQLFTCIGPVPKLRDLLGIEETALDKNTPLCLHLSNNFDPQEEVDIQMENLEATTKNLILEVIHVQPGETLDKVLTTNDTPQQEDKHKASLRDSSYSNTTPAWKTTNSTSLKAKQEQINTNLKVLQEAGLVEDAKAYQCILNKISKDIRMKHQMRQQGKDKIQQLQQTSNNLCTLSQEMQACIDLHKKYRESCVKTLVCEKSHISGEIHMIQSKGDDLQKVTEIQYTAQELFRRGVIVNPKDNCNELRRRVLTVKPDGDGFQVQLDDDCVHLRVLDLLYLQCSDCPYMKVFQYNMDVRLFLFLVYGKLSKM